MELTVDIIAALCAVAFLAGAIDAMAGGGGLLTIPALMAAGIPPVSAIATNKLQSSFGTASAFAAYLRAGHVDVWRFAVPAARATGRRRPWHVNENRRARPRRVRLRPRR